MLVGRDTELATLRALLAENRVVTLTGVGGVGKTALASVAASGAPVCELAPVARPGDVPAAVADALGFPSLDGAVVGMADAARLVVLDNCEHVLDAAAATVERLIAQCPEVTVLATGREALDVPGERVLPLEPLAVPDRGDPAQLATSPAAALLLARARDAGAEIVLDDEGVRAVATLCRRLDGLPLAIELAAARTRTLTPSEILAHLDDRLDLLVKPRLRGPSRHRSLDAAIAWSHERLPDATRRFFDRLGVLAGRFTAETAQAVAGDPDEDPLSVVEHLDQLVAQSLLSVRARGGRSWYDLLDTLRTFARAQLAARGELAAVQERRVEAMVELARGASRAVGGSSAPDPWATVHAAQADLHEALRQCLQHDEQPARAAALLRPLWMTVHSGPADTVAELGAALLARWPDRSSPDHAVAAAVTAFAHLARDEPEPAVRLARAADTAAADAFTAWLARRTLAVCELAEGRADRALRWADKALEAATDMPGAATEVAALRAIVLAVLGREEAAAAAAGAAEDEAIALGSATLRAWAGLISGSLLALRDPTAAQVALEKLVHDCQEAAYPLGEGAAGRAVGAIALARGDHAQAADWLGRGLEVFVRTGHVTHVRVTLRWVAGLMAAAGRSSSAPLRRAAGRVRTPVGEVLERAWLEPLLGVEPPDARTLPLPEAIALARGELDALTEPAPGTPVPDPPVPDRFALEGGVWSVTFAGRTVRLPDAKGLRDLAALLVRPGHEVHCTELAGAAVEQSDTGEVLDVQALRRYEARIVELQGELTEAEDAHDRGRAEAAGLELDLLVEQLASARGLGGRTRRTGGTVERARTAVTWRVRAAIRRLDEVHPPLGRHLHRAVRTGVWCCYQPEDPVAWQLSDDAVATGRTG
jgi:predicted ATPase